MKPRLHVVVDPMGWLCISVVLAVWLYNSVLIPKLVLLPHYEAGHIPWAIVFCEIPFLHPSIHAGIHIHNPFPLAARRVIMGV